MSEYFHVERPFLNQLATLGPCMMAPPKIIDYIVVHELCDMHQGDHTAAFWNEWVKSCRITKRERLA
jgi:hypothetical protein